MMPSHTSLRSAAIKAAARSFPRAGRTAARWSPLTAGGLGCLSLASILFACDRPSTPGRQSTADESTAATAAPRYQLPQADQRLCSAVALLIDTSGSMAQTVPDRAGEKQPKCVIARSALQRILDYTQQWRQQHPDRTLQLGIYRFSSSSAEILPMADFDAERAQAAVAELPAPAGGTAIGEALETGFRALYASGCVRKYIVCVTDGNNTTGPTPQRVARALHAQTGGEVELHFVAFDTSADDFAFLKKVNGFVVEAADGAQLDARLAAIYEQRILAEAPSVEKE